MSDNTWLVQKGNTGKIQLAFGGWRWQWFWLLGSKKTEFFVSYFFHNPEISRLILVLDFFSATFLMDWLNMMYFVGLDHDSWLPSVVLVVFLNLVLFGFLVCLAPLWSEEDFVFSGYILKRFDIYLEIEYENDKAETVETIYQSTWPDASASLAFPIWKWTDMDVKGRKYH